MKTHDGKCPYCNGTGDTSRMMASRLTELREKRGYTQAEVADTIGISRAQITNMERGITFGSIHTQIALADLFNVSLDYLLGRSDK